MNTDEKTQRKSRDRNNHVCSEKNKAKQNEYYCKNRDNLKAQRRVYYDRDRKNQLRQALSIVLPSSQLTDAFLETVMPMFKRTGVSGFAKRFAELQTLMTISVQKPTNLPTSIST